MNHTLSKVAIIGEEDETGSITVKAADCKEAIIDFCKEIDNKLFSSNSFI